MSTEIDWSKAPEGATRYHPETSKIIEHWLKMVGDEEWIWTSAGKRWMPHIDPVAGGEYYERPAPTWSGEGLPPVGTVCECQMRGYGDVWQKVIVLAHHNGYTWVTGDDGKHCFTVPPHGNFRPLRTPEQIAKQERDDAVHQMGLDAGFHGSVQDFATRLYMLGYRKVPL